MSNDVGKNIWYTSLSTIIVGILTYLFWFVTAKFAGAEIIGLTSAIVSFVTIVTTINGLNVSFGMKRSLGIASATKDMIQFKQVFTAAIVFVSIGVAISICVISIPQLSILENLGVNYDYILIIIAMIIALAFQFVFSESLVSSLNSKKLVLPLIVGSIIRFPIFFAAFYIFDAISIGTIVAYAALLFLSTTFYGIYCVRICKGIRTKAIENIGSNIKQLLKPSLASWIPQIISVLGYHLGIIAVFAIKGAAEGGKFYIPMAIFLVTLFIVTGINRVTHSLVGSIEGRDRQADFLSNTMRIAFMFTMPISISLLFFASDFLGILGSEFSSATVTLTILMFSLPFTIINEMIYYFIYGKGDNRSVLYLGLAGNISRTILYFALIPLYGSNGAALAFFIGAVIQLIISSILSKKHFLTIQYKKYLVFTLIPFVLGITLWQIHLHFIISSSIIFFVSLLAYTKLRLFTENDLHNVVFTGLPKNTAEKVYPILLKIVKKIH